MSVYPVNRDTDLLYLNEGPNSPDRLVTRQRTPAYIFGHEFPGEAEVTFFLEAGKGFTRVEVVAVNGGQTSTRRLNPPLYLDRGDPLATCEKICNNVRCEAATVLSFELLRWIKEAAGKKGVLTSIEIFVDRIITVLRHEVPSGES